MTTITSKETQLNEAYDKYADMLYHLSLSHMQHREDAEDVVQEVFCKYYTKMPSFTDAAHEKAWFIRVTINQCRDHLRHRRLRSHAPLHEIGDIAGQTGITDEAALDVMQLLSYLPEKYRTVIILHYLEGLSVEEISTTLTLGKSAVKMRLSRARDLLQKHLKEEDSLV